MRARWEMKADGGRHLEDSWNLVYPFVGEAHVQCSVTMYRSARYPQPTPRIYLQGSPSVINHLAIYMEHYLCLAFALHPRDIRRAIPARNYAPGDMHRYFRELAAKIPYRDSSPVIAIANAPQFGPPTRSPPAIFRTSELGAPDPPPPSTPTMMSSAGATASPTRAAPPPPPYARYDAHDTLNQSAAPAAARSGGVDGPPRLSSFGGRPPRDTATAVPTFARAIDVAYGRGRPTAPTMGDRVAASLSPRIAPTYVPAPAVPLSSQRASSRTRA